MAQEPWEPWDYPEPGHYKSMKVRITPQPAQPSQPSHPGQPSQPAKASHPASQALFEVVNTPCPVPPSGCKAIGGNELPQKRLEVTIFLSPFPHLAVVALGGTS
jgi:hypothetical protein